MWNIESLQQIILLGVVILASSLKWSRSQVLDFCVADLSLPLTPSGYPCKPTSNVTAKDFAYSGLAKKGDTTKSLYHNHLTTAFVQQFPALNGMGLCMARLDLAPGGAIQLHSHPVASEIIVVIQGTLIAGFVSTSNVQYVQTLSKGDIMLFPQALQHFQINNSTTKPALAFVALTASDPGLDFTSENMFAGNFDSKFIKATTLIGDAEIARLKKLFKGTQ